MTKDQYCVEVCKAKCCKWWSIKKQVFHVCPHLDCNTSKCRVHDKWKDKGQCSETYTAFVKGDLFEVQTMSIKEMIEGKLLPEWILEKCCYVNEEVLKKGEGKL